MVSALLRVNPTTRLPLKAKKYLLCQWGEHRAGILAQELGDGKLARRYCRRDSGANRLGQSEEQAWRAKGSTRRICPGGWRLGGVGTFGVVACVQEVAVTPAELLADAALIHYTIGASEKDEEEAIRQGGGLLHNRKA